MGKKKNKNVSSSRFEEQLCIVMEDHLKTYYNDPTTNCRYHLGILLSDQYNYPIGNNSIKFSDLSSGIHLLETGSLVNGRNNVGSITNLDDKVEEIIVPFKPQEGKEYFVLDQRSPSKKEEGKGVISLGIFYDGVKFFCKPSIYSDDNSEMSFLSPIQIGEKVAKVNEALGNYYKWTPDGFLQLPLQVSYVVRGEVLSVNDLKKLSKILI